jgi:hypothetical protein
MRWNSSSDVPDPCAVKKTFPMNTSSAGCHVERRHPAVVVAPADYLRALQEPLARGTFLQMGSTALAHQAFYGTSENAVKTQVWIAVSVCVLVAIIKKELKLEASLDTLLQILPVTLFDKMPLQQALAELTSGSHDLDSPNQLNLFDP